MIVPPAKGRPSTDGSSRIEARIERIFAVPWKVITPPDVPIVETHYEGMLDSQELAAAVQATVQACQSKGRTLLLADCTTLVGGHSFFDLYLVLDSSPMLELMRSIREAIIVSENTISAERVEFWETACRNRGIAVRVFRDRDSALVWLLGDAEMTSRDEAGDHAGNPVR